MPSIAEFLIIPAIYISILKTIPTAAYVPAVPINDTSGLNLTDSSTILIEYVNPGGLPGSFSGPVSFQLEADVPTGGTTVGALVHFAESNMGENLTTSTPWIAFINCDGNETIASQEWDIFTLARDRGAVSALLYTNTSASCLLNEDYIQNFEKPLDVFATWTNQTFRLIENQFMKTNKTFYNYTGSLLNDSGNAVNLSIEGTPLTTRTFLIGTLTGRNSSSHSTTSDIPGATSTSAPASKHGAPSSMIALYAITGLISLMFVLVILIGTRRARRHPERYGRRERDDTQGSQTTAGGIAQAILDTFPVIKFNRSAAHQDFRGAQPKRISSERELRSVVLPELSPRQTTTRRSSVTEDAETYHTASEEYDESIKLYVTPSGSRRGSRNDLKGSIEDATRSSATAEDQCPICLLDFEEGEDLRVLPCEREHMYHRSCIDPWLLDVSGSCPLCRKDFNHPTSEPQQPQPPPSPTSSTAQSQNLPPTASGFSKYLAFMRRERRSGRRRAGTVDSGVGPGRRREADQTGPGGY